MNMLIEIMNCLSFVLKNIIINYKYIYIYILILFNLRLGICIGMLKRLDMNVLNVFSR